MVICLTCFTALVAVGCISCVPILLDTFWPKKKCCKEPPRPCRSKCCVKKSNACTDPTKTATPCRSKCCSNTSNTSLAPC